MCCGNVDWTAKVRRVFPANIWVTQGSLWSASSVYMAADQTIAGLEHCCRSQKQELGLSPERKTFPFHTISGSLILPCIQTCTLLLASDISQSPIHSDLIFSSSVIPSLHISNSLHTAYLLWVSGDSVSALNMLLLRQHTYWTGFDCFVATPSPEVIPFLNARPVLAQESPAAGQLALYVCLQLHLLILYIHAWYGGYRKTVLHYLISFRRRWVLTGFKHKEKQKTHFIILRH